MIRLPLHLYVRGWLRVNTVHGSVFIFIYTFSNLLCNIKWFSVNK